MKKYPKTGKLMYVTRRTSKTALIYAVYDALSMAKGYDVTKEEIVDFINESKRTWGY